VLGVVLQHGTASQVTDVVSQCDLGRAFRSEPRSIGFLLFSNWMDGFFCFAMEVNLRVAVTSCRLQRGVHIAGSIALLFTVQPPESKIDPQRQVSSCVVDVQSSVGFQTTRTSEAKLMMKIRGT